MSPLGQAEGFPAGFRRVKLAKGQAADDFPPDRGRWMVTCRSFASFATARLALVAICLAAAPTGASAGQGGDAPFRCRLHETHAFLPELQTFSGFRWIACLVGVEAVEIEGVSINGGKCEAFDWSAGRTFVRGQTINIPYACLSPVKMAITGNGVTSEIRLR